MVLLRRSFFYQFINCLLLFQYLWSNFLDYEHLLVISLSELMNNKKMIAMAGKGRELHRLLVKNVEERVRER